MLLIDDLEKLPRARALRVLQAVQMLTQQRPNDCATRQCPYKVMRVACHRMTSYDIA